MLLHALSVRSFCPSERPGYSWSELEGKGLYMISLFRLAPDLYASQVPETLQRARQLFRLPLTAIFSFCLLH